MKNLYQNNLKKFKSVLKENNFEFDDISSEFFFEKQKDWSIFFDYNEVCKKIIRFKKQESSKIKVIPFNKIKGWGYNKKKNIENKKKNFFKIIGVEIFTKNREIKQNTWQQPLIKENHEIAGILGLIRGRFHGIPHYLCQFKVEPGNYGKIHLAPTLQATFSNIKKYHGGKKPFFSNYFSNTKNKKILFKKEILEDGGRFYKKRNIAILLEKNDAQNINLPSNNFVWLSLYQIKKLIKKKTIINPHIKTILSFI